MRSSRSTALALGMILAGTGAGWAEDSVGARELHERLVDRSFELTTGDGAILMLQYGREGAVRVFRNYEGGMIGRWAPEDGKLCHDFPPQGRVCSAVRLVDAELQVQGRRGTWRSMREAKADGHFHDGDWVAVYQIGGRAINAHFSIDGTTGRWRTLVGVTAPTEGCTGSNAPVEVLKQSAGELIFAINYDANIRGCGLPAVRLYRQGEGFVGTRESFPIEVRRR